jgi:hypothetical protein
VVPARRDIGGFIYVLSITPIHAKQVESAE